MRDETAQVGTRIISELSLIFRYSDLESRMKDELMNVKIKFTEQSQTVAELKQEISRLETKVNFQLHNTYIRYITKLTYFVELGNAC